VTLLPGRFASNDVRVMRDVLNTAGCYVLLLTDEEGKKDKSLLPSKTNAHSRRTFLSEVGFDMLALCALPFGSASTFFR
jgi:hypothetical protein